MSEPDSVSNPPSEPTDAADDEMRLPKQRSTRSYRGAASGEQLDSSGKITAFHCFVGLLLPIATQL